MTKIRLDSIVFDAGTQIRASINEQVVADYAERMSEGVVFPSVVLFHDGNHHYMADGFHRGLASKRVGLVEIAADVRPGTKADALWFALGANKANGQRLSSADKKHAVLLAFNNWPDMSGTKIAEQVGCSQQYVQQLRPQVTSTCNLPDRIIGKDGKSYPASKPNHKKPPDKSKAAVEQRLREMRTMAAEGHTSRQIASALDLSDEVCRERMRQEGIDVPADRVTGKTRHHKAVRIIEHIVMDAENLTADVGLINFRDIEPSDIGPWVKRLVAARGQLNTFIRRLMEEQKKHVEAA